MSRSLVGIPFSSPHNMRARSEGGEDVNFYLNP